MRITFDVADPAGNVTILVRTAVPKEEYSTIAQKLLAIDEIGAEQVGFLTEPRHGGEIRLEMMGGEFCGNALRSTGFWKASQAGCAQIVRTEISGCGSPLAVTADPAAGTAWCEMPLPQTITTLPLAGEPLDSVCFDGILHFVCFSAPTLSGEALRAALHEACIRCGAAAAGLLEVDAARETMRPSVYVEKTNTLYAEQSCASGSAATAALLALKRDGESRLSLRQPGGVIETRAEVREGRLLSLSIGGTIRLGKTQEAGI